MCDIVTVGRWMQKVHEEVDKVNGGWHKVDRGRCGGSGGGLQQINDIISEEKHVS